MYVAIIAIMKPSTLLLYVHTYVHVRTYMRTYACLHFCTLAMYLTTKIHMTVSTLLR